MQHVGAVDVFETAEDLVDEGLEVGVGERLAGADDGCEVALHQLLIKVCLVEVVWSWDVHVVETCNLCMLAS